MKIFANLKIHKFTYVFKYKGNMYKFTGAFAPVNQILGALKF